MSNGSSVVLTRQTSQEHVESFKGRFDPRDSINTLQALAELGDACLELADTPGVNPQRFAALAEICEWSAEASAEIDSHLVEIDGKFYTDDPEAWRRFCRPARPITEDTRFGLTTDGWRFGEEGEEVDHA